MDLILKSPEPSLRSSMVVILLPRHFLFIDRADLPFGKPVHHVGGRAAVDGEPWAAEPLRVPSGSGLVAWYRQTLNRCAAEWELSIE
ncbi:MAG TPA: hypothetical protein VK689_06590 [Armatimonadota bacterium]|nr:hypothetical protein [Armatimonadota bacterium]